MASFLDDVSSSMFSNPSTYDANMGFNMPSASNWSDSSMFSQMQPAQGIDWSGMGSDQYSGGYMPQVDLGNSFGGNYGTSGGDTGGGSSPWYAPITDAISTQWQNDPLGVIGKLGMGGLNTVGAVMGNIQSNKLAKKMSKQNDKVMAYQAAQMDRATKNQDIADRYNNSYDVTPAATATYNPLTAQQAAHYGETGSPGQQLFITPGQSTRVQLKTGGMVHGGCDGGCGGMCVEHAQHLANGGQADNIHAMLSEGEFVIPADVVSMLGDGNTRAGSSALTKMMHEIRNSARSAPNSSIPKPMDNPSAYLPKGSR